MLRLKALQSEVAEQALENPGERSAYGYGYASGAYNGIGMAWAAIEEMYRDSDERERDL